MKGLTSRRPSAAFAIGMIALFVALGGTAGAVATATVPLAKRALMADNAKKLNGVTAAQLGSAAAQAGAQLSAKVPGPASSAAGLVSIRRGTWTLAPDTEADFSVACASGEKAIGGGWDDPNGWAHAWDDRPSADGLAWAVYITMPAEATGQQTGGLYAICLK